MKPSALTGRRPLFRRLASAGLVLSLLVAGCGSDGEGEASTTTTTTAAPKTEATDAEATTTSTSSVASTTAAPDTTTTEGDAIEIVVEGGEVVSGTETIQVELGSTVRFVVTSDTADHVHIHGYDLFYDIAPDSRTEVSFTADVPGIFEIELENSHLLLVELEVS